MDRTEKESAELDQLESGDSESPEQDQNIKQQKVESFEEGSANTESEGFKNADAELTHPDAKPLETLKTDQPQEQTRQSPAISADNPDSAGSTNDIFNPVGEADQVVTESEPPDSIETDQTDESGDTTGHAPDDLDPQSTGDTEEEMPDKIDINEAAQRNGENPSPDADEKPQNTASQDHDHPEPVDGDSDAIEQPSQPSNDTMDDERVDTDTGNESEIENDDQTENEELAADEAGTIKAEIGPAVESESTDGDADHVDQQQGSPEEETSAESQAESQTSESTVDRTAEPPSGDSDDQAVADEKETAPEPSDSEAEAVGGTDPAAASETSDEDVDETDEAHEAEEQSMRAAASRTSITKIVVSALLITAVFSGFFIFENKSKTNKDETVAEAPSEDRPQPFKPEKKEIVDIPSVVTPSIYDDSVNEVNALRDTLLKKQAEVLALKKRYRHSIEELGKEILDEQRKADVQTFLQATNNNRIVFSLKTIQRRQAYIRQLEKPLEWVSEACEELLYLKRRVMTDLQVSAIASGIDMDRHVQQMHRALKEFRPTADRLAIDPTDARLESLETIWQQIQDQQDVVSAEPVYSKNQMISAQICAGDFNRIGELSEMTAATAKCITEMQASDLFLNQISEISPGAARQLCRWKGSWICMNGIRALSPRVAHYLFQWDGHWISLNGLTEFPAELGEALLRWPGRQLELMGLLDTADSNARIGIEFLAEWERSGGKLFVPNNLRKKIDALHQQSG